MKRFFAVLCVFMTISMVGSAFQQHPTQINDIPAANSQLVISPRLVRSITENSALFKGLEFITTTPDGKRLHSMQGDLSSPIPGDLEAAARRFVSDNAEIFNLPTSKVPYRLAVTRKEAAAGGEHVSFQMTLDGHPVRDSQIEIHFDARRCVMLAHGSLPEIHEISNNIALSPEKAIESALAVLEIVTLRHTPETRTVIFPVESENIGLCAYEVIVPAEEPLGDFHLWLDAETGAELARSNEMAFVHNGRGSVFPHHPLAGPAVEMELPHLTSTTLTGLYANVQNDDGPESQNSNSVHNYAPANTHFDEVNMYFYLNQIHDFFGKLGFRKLDQPMKAIVHYKDKLDNAFFSPSGNYFAFGDGNRLLDLAQEESIAYHEYSHGVMNAIVKVAYKGESGAMNEGQADYFAGSLSGDPLMGEYVVSKMGMPFLRNLENNLHYPENIANEVHDDGRIWGAVLWDLRCALGPKAADTLVHGGHYYLKSGNPTFFDGWQAILAADRNISQGLYGAAVNAVMRSRGIAPKAGFQRLLMREDLARMKRFSDIHRE